MKSPFLRSLAPLAVLAAAALAASARAPEDALAPRLRGHAQALLAARQAAGSAVPGAGTLRFEFNDPEREFVEFFPASVTVKRGLTLGLMDLAQRRATHALLGAALSHEGYLEVQNIASLEDVLRQTQLIGTLRLADDYTVQLYGQPRADEPWALKYEGHHVSLNVTSVGDEVRATPLFLGANPVEVRAGPRAGQRAFGRHFDLAASLLESFTPEQRAVAHAPASPAQEVVRRGVQAAPPAPVGLAAARMDAAQRARLLDLVRCFVRPLEEGLARELVERVTQAGIERVHFRWQGPARRGARCAFRIQGPAILIDYEVLQDAGSEDANHVHILVRDPARDLGADLLVAHREGERRVTETRSKRAVADMQAILAAANAFVINNGGRFPDSLDWLIQQDSNGARYLADPNGLVDPWGNLYVYAKPAPGETECHLKCLGADGAEGGTGEAADIAAPRSRR